MAFRRERLVVFGRAGMLGGSGILMGHAWAWVAIWAYSGLWRELHVRGLLLAFLWLRRSMIAPGCGISGGPQIFFYVLIQRVLQLSKTARDNNFYF